MPMPRGGALMAQGVLGKGCSGAKPNVPASYSRLSFTKIHTWTTGSLALGCLLATRKPNCIKLSISSSSVGHRSSFMDAATSESIAPDFTWSAMSLPEQFQVNLAIIGAGFEVEAAVLEGDILTDEAIDIPFYYPAQQTAWLSSLKVGTGRLVHLNELFQVGPAAPTGAVRHAAVACTPTAGALAASPSPGRDTSL